MTTSLEPSLTERYQGLATDLFGRIVAEERDAIQSAARAIADRIVADRIVFVIGPGGHSTLGAHEIYFRAGGLACISAVLDDGFALARGGLRSIGVERTPGYARAVLGATEIDSGDVLIVSNAYGVNAACIDSLDFCRERGITTIAVTSIDLQRALPADHPSRHPSGRNMCDVADIVIDSKVPMGDAVIDIDGVRERVGPISSLANFFALNALMLETVGVLVDRGYNPPIWRSANSPGADEANRDIIARYRSRIRGF